MRIAPRSLLTPLLAALVLVLVFNVTAASLRSSGGWRRLRPPAGPIQTNPYAPLDRLLADRSAPVPAALRDPFGFGVATLAAATPAARPRPPAAPPAPRMPVLTSIIWGDSDPRATIRWNGRDYSVRPSTLFDEFRVVSIARDQVVLDRGGESLMLRLASDKR